MKKFQFALPLAMMAFVFILPSLLSIFPDYFWFRSFGYLSTFLIQFKAKGLYFSLSFVGMALAYSLLAFLALRLRQDAPLNPYSLPTLWQKLFARVVQNPLSQIRLTPVLIRVVIVVLSLFGALAIQSHWVTLLKVFHATPFGIVDPIFHQDLGFYVFKLPFLNLIAGTLLWHGLFALVLMAFILGLPQTVMALWPGSRSPIRKLLLSVAALIVLAYAWTEWLGVYDCLFSQHRILFGAGYTEATVGRYLTYGIVALEVILAGTLLLSIWQKTYRNVAAVGVVLVLTATLLRAFIPGLIQAYTVAPNELAKETPYIRHHLDLTRFAYNLNNVKSKPFSANQTLTYADILKNETTLQNVRLWDEIPLRETFIQLQEIRPYYEFSSIDVDRYTLNNQPQQVMLSAREMETDQLPARAQNWINRHIVYTHGYGVCMAPVNQVVEEGLPFFYLKDLPPTASVPIQLTRPEIYFGEDTKDYALVNTTQKSFDYPKGDDNVYTHYQGKAGVSLGSFWHRLIFAIVQSDIKLLISELITPQTKILYDRDIRTMVRNVAPFLTYDADPYPVITASGRLVWIWDAYTTTDRIPYAEPFQEGYNYIRNAVKVTIDAYDGTLNFYVADTQDPIIRTYQGVFGHLFKPLNAMPDELRAHLRYPKDLFTVQASIYKTYHMQDVQVFYNREDVWAFPTLKADGETRNMEPYYMVMRVPGETQESYRLMVPFTPNGKSNMIAWFNANCEPGKLGELQVFKFPKEKVIYGPAQIEARIDQDTEISQKLTLWNQVGSQVIRGNLIVIPIENDLLYVEPVYLQATSGKLPELKRVIVSYDDTIVMAETLQDTLAQVFNQNETQRSKPEKSQPNVSPASGTQDLKAAFKSLKQSAAAGNWSGFGKAMDQLESAINRL
ncbi:MAG: UPF0182 family protein [Candidatus Margulisiibacteriota bacterium]